MKAPTPLHTWYCYCVLYSLLLRAAKKYPPKVLHKILHTRIVFTSVQNYQILGLLHYLDITLTKLCEIKRDLVKFYISFDKRKNMRYRCNSSTDFHKI